MKEMMLDNKCKTGHARGRRGRTAALFAAVAISVCMAVRLDGAVIDNFEGPVKFATGGGGTDYFLWGLTNGQMVIAKQYPIPLPPSNPLATYDNVYWPAPRLPDGNLDGGRTLELRMDLNHASADDLFFVLICFGPSAAGETGYSVFIDRNEVALEKYRVGYGLTTFYWDTLATTNENVTVKLAFTQTNRSLAITVKVVDKGNQRATLYERTFVDGPGRDGPMPPPDPHGLGLFKPEEGVPYTNFTTVAVGCSQMIRTTPPPLQMLLDNLEYDVYQPAPPLAIRPATLLTWPETPVPCMVEAAPDPDGPWTPCAGDYHEVVNGQHRMYVVPDEQVTCFRSASTLLYKDFTDLSGWFGPDQRGTATVTNDDLRLHLNLVSATPFDDMANWGCSMGPYGYVTMPTNGTLELRNDVVRASQDDAFASVSFWRTTPDYAAYGFSKDQNEIIIWKCCGVALFYAEEAAIKNENITLSLALTPRGSDLEIHARVFDRDNHNALLWERVVRDTPAADPTVPNGSWKGLVTYTDLHPAPYAGTNFFPLITCSYWNAQRAPNPPGAEVTFDSFAMWQYEVPALAVGPAALLSWTEAPVACRIVETATSLPGPWTTLFTGCSNFVNGRFRTFVPANEPARFFRLSEGSQVRIISWPTNISVLEGSNITLRVEATGPDPLRYEWRFNDEVIEGVTGNSFTITNAGPSDQGQYVVTVSDACGSVTTNAFLKVLVPPTIVEHPQSQTVRVGDTVTLSVSVTNTATLPVGYRWRHGGVTLTNQPLNAYTSTYTINNVQLGDAGDYTVVVTNAAKYSGYLSGRATLTVGP